MNVLVIDVRGLHFGYVGCHGNEWIQTPTLDRLAAEGVVFDQHHADRPEPEGACRSWRSGCYSLPPIDGEAPDADPANDLTRLLRAGGIVTWLVRDARRAGPLDFATGWDSVSQSARSSDQATTLECVLEAWQAALKKLAKIGRWLLWLELATLLPPWDVPSRYLKHYQVDGGDQVEDEESVVLEPMLDPQPGLIDLTDTVTFLRLQRTYAAAAGYLDAGLARVLEELEDRRLLDKVWLIVTSDHGMPLGEHGQVGLCRPWLHEELVHLPLLMRFPGKAEAGRRIGALTQPVDLTATLLAAFGLNPPPLHGHNLLPLIEGKSAQVRDFACSGLRLGDAVEWSLRSPDWAFLLPLRTSAADPERNAQLFVKPDDRWEVNNIVQHHPDLAGQLEQTLRDFVAATHRPVSMVNGQVRSVE